MCRVRVYVPRTRQFYWLSSLQLCITVHLLYPMPDTRHTQHLRTGTSIPSQWYPPPPMPRRSNVTGFPMYNLSPWLPVVARHCRYSMPFLQLWSCPLFSPLDTLLFYYYFTLKDGSAVPILPQWTYWRVLSIWGHRSKFMKYEPFISVLLKGASNLWFSLPVHQKRCKLALIQWNYSLQMCVQTATFFCILLIL